MTEPFEILIVEDYESDAQFALRLFQRNRIANKLQVIQDGAEAVDYVFGRGPWAGRNTAHPPLVVLLDIRLPKLDGWEVLRQLKNNPLTRGIPVIMISGSLFGDEKEQSLQLGAIECLSKPLRIVELKTALANSGLVWAMADQEELKQAAG
jgi:two-component system, response regulator